MAAAIDPLMVQFLDWLAARPRSYAEVMEAWRTSCPRMTIWEDAQLEGFVRFETPDRVALTPAGAAARGSGLL